MDFSKLTPAIEQRILDFLNYARIPTDISGKEPQDGPVFDNPNTGYGDQVRDYDIGELVAGRIIKLRDSLPGKVFSSARQLDEVKGFGQDKLNDLIFNFPTPATTLAPCEPKFCCRPRLALP